MNKGENELTSSSEEHGNQNTDMLDLNQIVERLDNNEDEIIRLKKELGGKRRDIWEKTKISVNLASALALATVAVIGSIFIPKSFNQQSLESKKVIELSKLVPLVYEDSTDVRALIISMSSYGETAVPYLFLVLRDAVQEGDSALRKAITSSIRYLEPDARVELMERLDKEIRSLSETNVQNNIGFMYHLIQSLSKAGVDTGMQRIFTKYFRKVSRFSSNQYDLNELNGLILETLKGTDFRISNLELTNLVFDGTTLDEIDFGGCDLSGSQFTGCGMVGCGFGKANLASCNFEGAKFFGPHDDDRAIWKTFDRLSQSKWQNAIFDPDVSEILEELVKEKPDTSQILAAIITLKRGF